MQWVETTGRTVEQAKNLALDQLGVDADEAEFEILEEPRPGLFGRVRGEARVRARVRPTRPRPKVERRERRRRGARSSEHATDTAQGESTTTADAPDVVGEPSPSDDQSATAAAPSAGRRSGRRRARRTGSSASADGDADPVTDGPPSPTLTANATREEPAMTSGNDTPTIDPAAVGAEATRFLEGLLGAFGLQGQVSCTQDEQELDVRVEGADLGLLVGPRGSTLLAVQDLTRVVSQRRLGDHTTRLRVDVAGYRERRRAALERFATQMADEVVASGVARVLEPMASADRKVIHDVLAGRSDVATRSEGDEPQRRVIIDPVG
jgi:spoIIIJ-associated protein